MLGTRHKAGPVTSAFMRHLHTSPGTRGARPGHPHSHGLIRRHKPSKGGGSLLQELGRSVQQLLGLQWEPLELQWQPEGYVRLTRPAAGQQQPITQQRSRRRRAAGPSKFQRRHQPWSRTLLQQLCEAGKFLLALQQQVPPQSSVLLSRAGAGLQKACALAFVWLRADMSPAWIAAELTWLPAAREASQPAALPAPPGSSGQGVGAEGSGKDGARQVALSRAFLKEYQPWGMSPREQQRVEDQLGQVEEWVYKIEEAYGPVWICGKRFEGKEMRLGCQEVFDTVWTGTFFEDVLPLLPGEEGEGPNCIYWLPSGPVDWNYDDDEDEDDWSESRSTAMALGSRHFIREVYKCHSGCSSTFKGGALDVVSFTDLLWEEAVMFRPAGGWNSRY